MRRESAMMHHENVPAVVSDSNDNSGSRGTFHLLMLHRYTLSQLPQIRGWEPFHISSISFLIRAELPCNYMTPEAGA